jgi:hypothetical protein
LKNARERMDILAAYREVGSYRGADAARPQFQPPGAERLVIALRKHAPHVPLHIARRRLVLATL